MTFILRHPLPRPLCWEPTNLAGVCFPEIVKCNQETPLPSPIYSARTDLSQAAFALWVYDRDAVGRGKYKNPGVIDYTLVARKNPP